MRCVDAFSTDHLYLPVATGSSVGLGMYAAKSLGLTTRWVDDDVGLDYPASEVRWVLVAEV